MTVAGKIEHKRFRPDQMKVIRPKAGARDPASASGASASGAPAPVAVPPPVESAEDEALAASMMAD